MKNNEKIDYFCNYFIGQINAIQSLCINEEGEDLSDPARHQLRFYQKVLLINSVDTLAGIRFPKQRYPKLNKQNQGRFNKFLHVSECWTKGIYVSIPFLSEKIGTGKISNGKLTEFIENKMRNLSTEDGSFNINFKDIDEPISTLLPHVTTELEECAVKSCQHYELMYRYRNYLVHESREPGKAMEVTPDWIDPYYHGYIGEEKLYLAYPLGVFVKILENSVKYISEYLKEHKLDPYNFVTETSRW